jgi:SAM-dependent methyltransferase
MWPRQHAARASPATARPLESIRVTPAGKERLKRLLGARGLQVARPLREIVTAWRHSLSSAAEPAAEGEPPVPPPRMLLRVVGNPDRRWFLEGGRNAARDIEAALGSRGVRVADLDSILDFGCGCGRVLRYLQELPADLHGSDLDGKAVRWCARHLPRGRFAVNAVEPPLAYQDRRFDLVYAFSVFTHLPVGLQGPWMDELRRVLRPGGHLLFTVHGRGFARQLDASESGEFEAGRLVVRDGPPGSNYCAVFHPRRYLEELVAPRFEILEVWEEGSRGNSPQDLVLARKPAA